MSVYYKEKRELAADPRVFVYGLIDPRDGTIFYVGATRLPRTRFANHLNERRPLPRVAVIREIVANGQRPTMKVLEEVRGDDWATREIHWVRKCKAKGWARANCSDGGAGSGVNPTKERREKLAASNRVRSGPANPNYGRKFSAEVRSKVSLALMRKHPACRRVVVLDTGQEFHSVLEAARHFGVSHRAIRTACDRRGTSCGHRMRYAEDRE